MNRLRVLSLTMLMLMLASRLPGQPVGSGSQIVACNDGTISFSVARAYRDLNFLSGYQWKFQGWYNVDPGKCNEIGEPEDYHNGGLLRKDSVTLLAFAFYDSTGTWGAVRVRDYPDSLFKPSSQQFCVKHDVFGYDRDSPGGDLPRECNGAQTGYFLIPASFEYTASGFPNKDGLVSMDKLHVKLAPSARAIPLGKQSSSGLGGDLGAFLDSMAANSKSSASTSPSPTPAVPAVAPAPSVARALQRRRLAPIMVGKVDVSHLAGLQRGDTPEYVSSIFGPPTSGSAQDSSAFGGYPHRGSDGFSIRVNYDLNNVLSQMKVYSKGSRGAVDPLLDLLGKSESDAVALLGSPKKRESLWDIDEIDLIWNFPMDGRPSPQYAYPLSEQTLTLHYRTGVGCVSITLDW